MDRSLTALEARLETVVLDSCSNDELRDIVSDIQQGQRQLVAYLTCVVAVVKAREVAGSGPTAHDVMRSGGNISQREAKRQTARAELAEKLPKTGQAARSGDAKTENIDATIQALEKLTSDQRKAFAALDDEIAQKAVSLRPETFRRHLNRELRRIREENPPPIGDASDAEIEKAKSRFSMGRRANGRWWLSGDLDDERGTVIDATIRDIATQLANSPNPNTNQRAAALFDLIAGRDDLVAVPDSETTDARQDDTGLNAETSRTGGNSGHGAGSDGTGTTCPPRTKRRRRRYGSIFGRKRMGVGYILDAATLFSGPHPDTLAQHWNGDDVDPRNAMRMACDTDLYAVLVDKCGQVTGVGRTHRTATREQRLALRALYDSCPLDGTPFGQCEIHHVDWWEHGGLTELDNLIPLSEAWHHRIHDQGWKLVMEPDRTLKVYRPDGTLDETVDPPTPLTRPQAA